MAEPEIVPPHREDLGEFVSRHAGEAGVRMMHVRSLGVVGAILAMLTMGAAVGFGLLMLFGRALLAAGVSWLLWPYVFSPSFTQWVFGADRAPFWKLFLLMVILGTLAKALRPAGWGRK